MDPSHAQKIASNPRLSRLGELMARAATRKQQAREQDRLRPNDDDSQAVDPLLATFNTHRDLSIGEVMDLTGQSRTTVHRRLIEMVEAGLLERRGEGRASRYYRLQNKKFYDHEAEKISI